MGIVGPYRLLERLGEGGMGDVWLAEQVSPVRRQVAVKIIKAGLDTAQVVARFEAERQALALMDHAAIARVFDAGSTDSGRPYFAMEYVRGDMLTAYCDRHRLSIPERLHLFVQLCEGVQHAHQKGIIHRDLKPSNVLVTAQDDHPIPKIIDFGVAKAMSQPLTDHTLYTSLGGFVGTPEYMSPEQMGGPDVDTRSDIYALGVILYELLTGMLPFDRQVFANTPIDQIQRTVREVDPPKPSTRLTRGGDGTAAAAGNRRTESPRLAAMLRGDLDWITMRCLEKDRARRYGSASELAADVRRHLGNLPVLAGPPSAVYRTRKFIRRHRVSVATAAMFVVFLITLAAVTFVQSRRVASERDRANLEAQRANREAATAKRVADFLVGLFRVSDPSESRGASLTAREILDKGSRDVDTTLAGERELQARLQTTIGSVYTSLGLYPEAITQLEKAVATQRTVLGDSHAETLKTTSQLADAYWYLNRLAEAERLYRRIGDERERTLGADHPDTLRARFDLASTFLQQRRWQEAEALMSSTLPIQKRVLGPRHEDTLSTLNNLQALYFAQGRYAEALPVAQEVNDAWLEMYGPDHPSSLQATHNLATVYDRLGRDAEAERLYLATIDRKRRVIGPTHPQLAMTQTALAELYSKQRRFAEAEPFALAAYETYRLRLGDQHQRTREAIQLLVTLYGDWNKPAEASRWRRKEAAPGPAPQR